MEVPPLPVSVDKGRPPTKRWLPETNSPAASMRFAEKSGQALAGHENKPKACHIQRKILRRDSRVGSLVRAATEGQTSLATRSCLVAISFLTLPGAENKEKYVVGAHGLPQWLLGISQSKNGAAASLVSVNGFSSSSTSSISFFVLFQTNPTKVTRSFAFSNNMTADLATLPRQPTLSLWSGRREHSAFVSATTRRGANL